MRLQAIIGKQKFKPKKVTLSEIKEIQTLLSSGRFGRISTTDKQTLAEINNSELTAKDKFYIDFFDLNDISVVYSDLTQKRIYQ